MAGTKEKVNFVVKPGEHVLTHENLPHIIASANGRFPHVRLNSLVTTGELGKSGIVVSNPNGPIVAAVRHMDWIPASIEGEDVAFGNEQHTGHLERSFLVEESNREVQLHAKSMLAGLRELENLKQFSKYNEGAGGGGSEPEAWMIDKNGNPYPIPDGGELQSNCIEETIEPHSSAQGFLVARAKQILKRKAAHKDAIIVDTSSMTTSTPMDMKIGTTGDNGPYITAMQHKLWSQYMNCLDPTARQLMNTLAKEFQFIDWHDMHEKLGNMTYLVFSASHLSIGLPHIRPGLESMAIPEQEAIAVADMFNSNFGTLAEMLMLSTPMVFGKTPRVQTDQGEMWPRDMRALMRYTLDTPYPAEFIGDPKTYRERVTHQITTGLSHTLDRAAYMAVIQSPDTGEVVERSVMHGRVRLRATSSEPRNLSGRVEFTGCSASPSIHDEVARNSLLQLMMIGAYEALAEGKQPMEYFKKEFPSMGRWQEQKDLIIEANLHGFKTEKVNALIQEGLQFAKRMEEKYPALKEQVDLVLARLQNLQAEPVVTLAEYVENPQGPFSEVVQNELKSGKSPLEVTIAIEQYQLTMARKFIDAEELSE